MFMNKHHISLYREVSAKTGNQVADAFTSLGQKLLAKGGNNSDNEQNRRVILSDSKKNNR